VDTWRSTYGGIVPEEHLANLSYGKAEQAAERRLGDSQSGYFAFVAVTDDGRIVGFAGARQASEEAAASRGALEALYVVEAYQALGVGRQLVSAVARRLIQMGIRSMIVWVLKDNACRGFYEHLGGRQLGSQTIAIGGRECEEVAYGWDDLMVLTGMRDEAA
jgi:L-amino acid N-acyltransferase YncA